MVGLSIFFHSFSARKKTQKPKMPPKKAKMPPKEDGCEDHEKRSGGRKRSPPPPPAEVVAKTAAAPPTEVAKKAMTAPQVAAVKSAALAAVAITPPGERSMTQEAKGAGKEKKDTGPVTHEVLAEKFKCFTVVKKEQYGSYLNIPSSMQQRDTLLLCNKCGPNKASGKAWFGTLKAHRLKQHVD